MNFDLKSREFWDAEATRKEVLRVFDVCHGCRVCETYCPSFVDLFKFTDENFGNVYSLSEEQIHQVIQECYQCKLCYIVCPYVPPHEWDIDFPRTILRAHLGDVRSKKLTLGDRLVNWMLGDTDRVGSLACKFAGLANWANRHPRLRASMEKFLGIHKDRLLPTFRSETFAQWYSKRPRPASSAPSAGTDKTERTEGTEKAVFFYTCLVNYNEPEIGKAAVAVFDRNGVDYIIPQQQCCGLPFLDTGQVDRALAKIKANVKTLSQAVRKGYKVVVPNASCSYMLKLDYPRLLPGEETQLVAENTYDLSEFLVKLHETGRLDLNFSEKIGKIRYHQPCHLKAQNIGFKAQELMKLIPGAEVARMQCCSGHDGSWSVRKENFEASMKVGKPLFKFMNAKDCCLTTDCPLSAIQIQQATGQKPVHPIEVLARAYGLEAER
ncbi:MAG: anaerobic glycerol-3-phosphate dehydrogenase subunit C [Acidobacteria bacterium]|nr:anaerobic glycerol-3-phosphate dehydrogenase subunit C [Acidobacteriota bacterium]